MTKNSSALVIGAGIAGIKASLELAEMGHMVYLLDKNPTIGGKLTTLEKQYPTDDCTLCQMLPTFGSDKTIECCLRKDLEHENIEIITNAEVEKLNGKVKEFSVYVKKKIGYIDNDKCVDCGYCDEICPVTVEIENSIRKAVYVKSPMAVPNSYIIDEENCTKCGKCVDICPTNAINFSENNKEIKLDVGAIIVALGFEEFDPTELKQYNYGNNPNILTNMEFERLYSGFGIHQGDLLRPSDSKKIKKLAILQCIGSRDTQRNYCSSACCMIALKEAILAKESSPETDVTIFYMDMRALGKTYHQYYEKAKKMGIKFVNCRVPKIDITEDGDLRATYSEKGELREEKFDIVVLSNGFIAPKNNIKLSEILGIKLNEHGYFNTSNISSIDTIKEGIYVCGTAVEPKDITDTIIEAIAAAMKASLLLDKKIENKDKNKRISVNEEPRIGIFITEPRNELEKKLDILELEKYSKNLSNVKVVRRIKLPSESLSLIKSEISEKSVNRILFALHEPQFVLRKSKPLKEMVKNLPVVIHDINIPISKDLDKDKNTENAKKQIEISVEKLKMEEDYPLFKEEVVKKALIIGGGISGLTSALAIAEKGFEVDLIDKSDRLGGNLLSTFYTIEGLDTQKFLKDTINKVEKNKLINIYKNTKIEEVSGYVGNFQTKLKTKDEIIELKHGTIIIATGGKVKIPNEYSYGKDKKIITQKELEMKIIENKINAKTIVMIQCVGSREDEDSYCSRICCSEALKNAMKLKEENNDLNIYILNRDIMCYGFLEEQYQKAGDLGINFVRYDMKDKPKITIKKNIAVEVRDSVLGEKVNIDTDLLILSTGIIPNENQDIAQKIGLPLDDFGFFKEANAKFKPLEFLKAGIFVCGLAHSPRNLKEKISQAYAAAGRAVTILSKENLQSREQISEVNERWCVGCELCIVACPYSARVLDEEKGVAKTIDILCQGCGVCAMICPSGVSKLRGARDKQIFALVDVAV